MRKYINVVLLGFIWSVYYTAAKVVNGQISPFSTGLIIRFTVFVAFTCMFVARSRIKELFAVKPVAGYLILIGCVGFLLDITAFLGFRFASSAATGTVLLKTDILITVLISAFIYREKFTLKDCLLVACMLAGVVMVMGVNPLDMRFQSSSALFVLSALFVSINAFLIKRVQTQAVCAVSNETIAYYNNFVAMIFFLASSFFFGTLKEAPVPLSHPKLAAAAAAGAASQFFVYVFYYKSLKRLPVWIVKVLLLLIPVFTLLTDAVLFGVIPGWYELAGTAIILAGAFRMITAKNRNSRPAGENETENEPEKETA